VGVWNGTGSISLVKSRLAAQGRAFFELDGGQKKQDAGQVVLITCPSVKIRREGADLTARRSDFSGTTAEIATY